MYSMEIKILGMKLRLECILISMVIGAVLGCALLCGTAKVSVKEGMQILGANVDYVMGKGVPGDTWTQNPPALTQQYETNEGPQVPLPEGQLFFLANNAFKPECCTPASPIAYSSSTGCACVTKEQIDYINKRGGNRNPCGGGF